MADNDFTGNGHDRDVLLDLALAAVTGVRQGDSLLAPVLVSMDLADLRRFAGKVALVGAWALEAADVDALSATVERVQQAMSS